MQTAVTSKVRGSWLEVTQLVFSITSFYSSLFSIKAYKSTATTVPPMKEHPGLIKTLGY